VYTSLPIKADFIHLKIEYMIRKEMDPFALIGETIYQAEKSEKGKVTFCEGLCTEVTKTQALNTGSDRHGRLMPASYKVTIKDHGKFNLRDIYENKEDIISML
jgi:hypothetical protein